MGRWLSDYNIAGGRQGVVYGSYPYKSLIRFQDPLPFNKEMQVKGTKVIYGSEAIRLEALIESVKHVASVFGFKPIFLPSLDYTETYTQTAGKEVLNQMYIFEDKGGRSLCLRPEATATCQELATTLFKIEKDVRLYYVQKCFRYEQPQAGRYREFTQFGVEILNPSKDYSEELIDLAANMCRGQLYSSEFEIKKGVKRGLGIYNADGFEVLVPKLGAQKQIIGGGPYKDGIGFAIGLERLLLAKNMVEVA